MKSSLALLTLSLTAFAPASAIGQVRSDAARAPDQQDEQIEFSADSIDYDFENDLVTAEGNVILNRDGYKLRADQVLWNRKPAL